MRDLKFSNINNGTSRIYSFGYLYECEKITFGMPCCQIGKICVQIKSSGMYLVRFDILKDLK